MRKLLVRIFTLNQENFKKKRLFLKRSCKHCKNKTKLSHFYLSFESMICCFDSGKVNFENKNKILCSMFQLFEFETLDIQSFWD